MDNQRLLIWAFYGLMAWMTYQTWVQDYAPKPTPVVADQTEQLPETAALEPDAAEDLPEISDTSASSSLAPSAAADQPSDAEPAAPSIRVTTDVLELEISTKGGTLQKAKLLGYPVAKDRPDALIELLSNDPDTMGLIESGIRATAGGAEAIQKVQTSNYDINPLILSSHAEGPNAATQQLV